MKIPELNSDLLIIILHSVIASTNFWIAIVFDFVFGPDGNEEGFSISCVQVRSELTTLLMCKGLARAFPGYFTPTNAIDLNFKNCEMTN